MTKQKQPFGQPLSGMTPRRRAQLFSVMGGIETKHMTVLIWHLNNLVRADEVLEWLIRNRKTGREFIYFVCEHDGSILKTAAEILRRLNHDRVMKKIIAGRDYLA